MGHITALNSLCGEKSASPYICHDCLVTSRWQQQCAWIHSVHGDRLQIMGSYLISQGQTEGTHIEQQRVWRPEEVVDWSRVPRLIATHPSVTSPDYSLLRHQRQWLKTTITSRRSVINGCARYQRLTHDKQPAPRISMRDARASFPSCAPSTCGSSDGSWRASRHPPGQQRWHHARPVSFISYVIIPVALGSKRWSAFFENEK